MRYMRYLPYCTSVFICDDDTKNTKTDTFVEDNDDDYVFRPRYDDIDYF